ncbi:hypothetical protein ACU686_06105 [Yinghuangia aomiensis]
MTGTFVLTAPGSLTLTPKGYKTDTGVDLGGTVVHSITTCNPATGSVPRPAATLNVQGQQTADPVVSGPAESHPGFEIDLTGSNFAPSATPQLSLCQSDGSQCDPNLFTSNTLAIDAQGKLSGKATLRATMLPSGTYKVKVSDGTKSGSYSLNVTPYVSGAPAVTVTPSAGKVGDTVTVKGVNFPPSTGVFVFESNANGDMIGSIDSPGTDVTGNVTSQITITNSGHHRDPHHGLRFRDGRCAVHDRHRHAAFAERDGDVGSGGPVDDPGRRRAELRQRDAER